MSDIEYGYAINTRRDVRILRDLYLGRPDLYGSFTDNEEFQKSGYINGQLSYPYGVRAYTIKDLVSKRATITDTGHYVFVFRADPQDWLDEDFFRYNQLQKKLDELSELSYISEDEFKEAIKKAKNSYNETNAFWFLLAVTKELAMMASSRRDRMWRRILFDLDFDGIHYRDGIYIVMDGSDRIDLDIVPYQNWKEDMRRNVVNRINKQNTLMWGDRNRIAKRRTKRFRTMRSPSKLDRINQALDTIQQSWGM